MTDDMIYLRGKALTPEEAGLDVPPGESLIELTDEEFKTVVEGFKQLMQLRAHGCICASGKFLGIVDVVDVEDGCPAPRDLHKRT